jgi:hypothetical protein
MNLESMASGVIGGVNANTAVTIKRAIGYVYSDAGDGTQVPQYQIVNTYAQIQALSGTDIQRLNNLNIQGLMCAAYVDARIHAIVRKDGKGGDLFVFRGNTWLAVHILENWSEWTKVVLVLQVDAT